MDQVLNALKCANCREFLSTPVNLPCGHMICQTHTQVTDEQIICAECGSRHSNKVFIVNEAVSKMIKAQLNKFDFGRQHSETLKSCNYLKSLIYKNEAMVNDLEYFIHESIGELKNKVMLRSENLKVRLDETTQKFIDDLDEYEKRCKTHFGDTNSKESFSSLLDEIKKQNEEAKNMCQEWSSVLNELKVDAEKWTEIKLKCDESLNNMCEKVKDFEKEVFINELDVQKFKVDFFEKSNIDPLFEKKIFLESTILDPSFYIQFLELCKLKFYRHEFKLLYRGSRDGFGAAHFHSKCDNQPNTVTIIKTTKDYIFGGYTQIGWKNSGGYCNDSKAFLFSLVNRFKKPFICDVLRQAGAIFCRSDYGPIFGKCDIVIFNNSNNKIKASYSSGMSYYKIPNNIKDQNGYFFSDAKHFQVSEIEVFQIENFLTV